MKRVVGSPGTWSGMALRLSQCLFAAASTFAMVSGFGYSNYSAYFYLNLALILQIMWSLGLACKDIFALRNKKDLHTWDNLLFIVMVDWPKLLHPTSSSWNLEPAKVYLSENINCQCITGRGYFHVLRSLCLREPDNFLHVGCALLRGILAAGLPAVCAFGRPGVHHVVAASCILFLRVLATGFALLVISRAQNRRHVMLIVSQDSGG